MFDIIIIYSFTHNSQETYQLATPISPILQMRKLRLGKVKQFAQSLTS